MITALERDRQGAGRSSGRNGSRRLDEPRRRPFVPGPPGLTGERASRLLHLAGTNSPNWKPWPVTPKCHRISPPWARADPPDRETFPIRRGEH